LGVFLNLFTLKSTIFLYVNYAYFCFIILTTLKYHSNKFLELKPKDEVTLPSPGVSFWLILECSKLQFFPFISMGAYFFHLILFFFHPLNIDRRVQKGNIQGIKSFPFK